MKELKYLRKLNEKHFLKEDGTIEAHIYQDKVHYLKNNEYVEIDNTLVLDNNRYHNKDNDLQVSFSKESDEGLLEINKDNHYLNFFIKDSNKVSNKPLKRDNKIRKKGVIKYLNIFDNIDVDYQILPNKIKEQIIIHDKNSIKDKFVFEIKTNLNLVLKEDGSIISDKFKIEKPFMKDSNNLINDNIYYELIDKNDGYELILNLDQQWLNSDIKYPVYIDPTISEENVTGFQDTYISSKYPNKNYGNEKYLIATTFEDEICNTLIKFDLPTITTSDSIISAYLNLVGYPNSKVFESEGELNGDVIYSNTAPYVLASPINKNWSENTATWSNMKDCYLEDEMEDSWIYRASILHDDNTATAQINTFNITRLVKKWYLEGNNYGILLWSKAKVEDYYPIYFSREYEDLGPYVIINYRNQNGIESYMEYATFQSNGFVNYINYVNGNMITNFDLCNTVGGNLVVDLTLFYNTNDVILNNDNGFGIGIKLNIYQTLTEVIINDNKMYQYLDGDGTVHYFKLKESEDGSINENIYVDEDGLSFTLDITTYTISDKNGNKMIFTKNGSIYYLTKIQRIDDKIVEIIYENNKIIKVIDGFDNEINLQYETDKIIITSQTNTINLFYNNNKLTSIQDNTGIINISYNSNNLISSLVDLNGEKISFTYYDVSPYKIKKIILYGVDDQLGKSYDFSYDLYTTKVKDNKNKNYIRTFNDYGNTISYAILDDDENTAKGYGKSYSYGNKNENKNKLLNSLPLTKYVNNLLLNTSFEEETQIFSSNDLNISLSEEEKLSGLRSLKLSGSGTASTSLEEMNTQYYTFSFYSKSDKSFKIQINDDEIVNISSSNHFVRNKVTTYNTDSVLKISFILDNNLVYIDDIQLEEGKIANFYNMVDNSDFRYGSTGWLEGIPGFNLKNADLSNKIFLLNNGNRVLKFNYINESLLKRFPFKFKKGDKLYVSFWYKNQSLMDTGVESADHDSYNNNKSSYVGLGVFKYDSYRMTISKLKRSENWIFHSEIFEFEEDVDEFYINFGTFILIGELFISNISLFKIDGYNHFDYDNNSNLISFKDANNNESVFKYDENNQLIKMTDPLGNNLHYEYDKYIPTRVLRGISPSGIANEIIYDDFGNPIVTKIQADAKELTDGIYYIKIKGNHEYLKVNPILKNVILSEDDCSHEKFEITINDNLMTIDPIFHNNIYISNSLFNNIAFEYIKQEDNSYMLKCGSKYVTVGPFGLELSDVDDKLNQCFYFENENSKLYIENSAEYSSDGRFLTKTIDTLFNETSYATNDKGLITSMTDALNNVTNYTYNNKDQLTKITKGEMEVDYEYDGTLLSKIIQNNKEYSFNYDEFLNTKSVYINNNKLIENNYEENNGNLLNSVYGNNHTIGYTYDEFNRILTLNKMNNTYKYYYDNFGNVKRIDSNDNTYYYDYDFSQRLIGYEENNFKIDYGYNELDNLVSKKQVLNNLSNTYLYEHNNEDNITKITNDNIIINYTYDELQRLKERNINNYITKYSYITNGNRTSDLIDTIEENNNIYKYKYDKLGNIIKIIKNNNLINRYYYDQYNQLVKEENDNETITYEYDNFGNILNKKTYNNDILLTTDTYLYDNANWKDQLTKYNDISITYDAIGNPITIGNINLSWINGRQLNNYTDTTNNLNISYKYNKDGIRTEKNINGNITKYYVEGNKIIYLQTNNYVLYFVYENDALIGFKYAGNNYYYLKNIQNDILGILNSSFEQVVSYEYDSYGKIKSIKDGLGNVITDTNNIAYINPFRYRSYFYDDETGLYYLNSRYYNPTWGRFINADGILGANKDILSYNLYAYCSNNVINGIDRNGKIVSFLAKQIWNLISLTLRKIGMPISAKFLKASLSENIEYLMYFGNTFVSNKIKQDSSFRESLANEVSDTNGYVNDSFQVQFDDVDLRGSLNNATVFYEGKIENGFGKLNIKIYDVYDFDYNSYKGDLIDLIFTFGNNLAWLDQSVGIINNYEIYIVFQYDIYN